MSGRLLGLGACLPERRLTNAMLEEMVDTSDAWIRQRTGISERRILDGPLLEPAVAAAREALADAGITPENLGFIVCATISSDRICPGMASSVQAVLGATCPAMDINAACSGFLYALHTAMKLYEGKPMLVIGAEKISSLVDWTDRASCVLFGDGVGAVVYGEDASLPPGGVMASRLFAHADRDGAIDIGPQEPGGPQRIVMAGAKVYRFATRALCNAVRAVLGDAALSMNDIDWLVPHQANARIVEDAVKLLRLPEERVFMNIANVGNTSAASIPLALYQLARSGKLQRGQRVCMTAFGGGLTSAAMLLRW